MNKIKESRKSQIELLFSYESVYFKRVIILKKETHVETYKIQNTLTITTIVYLTNKNQFQTT